jgi:hypothetical protein
MMVIIEVTVKTNTWWVLKGLSRKYDKTKLISDFEFMCLFLKKNPDRQVHKYSGQTVTTHLLIVKSD